MDFNAGMTGSTARKELMITVFVWRPSDGYGHASMLVDGGRPSGSIYISYWPADQGRELNWLPPGSSGMRNFNAPAIRNRTFEADELGERDRNTDPPRYPNYRMCLDGLDETMIKRWWSEAQRTWGRWDATSYNCSTVVATALNAGGALRFCRRGALSYWNSNNAFWTPMNIVQYVSEISAGLDAHLLEPDRGILAPIRRLIR